jgi:hypothetical protein
MIVPVKLLDRELSIPSDRMERKNEVFVKRGYTEMDSVYYKLPKNYIVDQLPENVNISSAFGTYSMITENLGDGVLCVRTFRLEPGLYPASEYKEFVSFLEQSLQYDNSKFSLKKGM